MQRVRFVMFGKLLAATVVLVLQISCSSPERVDVLPVDPPEVETSNPAANFQRAIERYLIRETVAGGFHNPESLVHVTMLASRIEVGEVVSITERTISGDFKDSPEVADRLFLFFGLLFCPSTAMHPCALLAQDSPDIISPLAKKWPQHLNLFILHGVPFMVSRVSASTNPARPGEVVTAIRKIANTELAYNAHLRPTLPPCIAAEYFLQHADWRGLKAVNDLRPYVTGVLQQQSTAISIRFADEEDRLKRVHSWRHMVRCEHDRRVSWNSTTLRFEANLPRDFWDNKFAQE